MAGRRVGRRRALPGGEAGRRPLLCIAPNNRRLPCSTHLVVIAQLVQGAVAPRHLAHRPLLGLLCTQDSRGKQGRGGSAAGGEGGTAAAAAAALLLPVPTPTPSAELIPLPHL